MQAPARSVTLSSAEVFALADQARAQRDFDTAEKAYRLLAENRDAEIRTEARFRLAMMLGDDMHRPADAAVEFRRILDEKPDAVRVRLELARMQDAMGNLAAARRELRAAEATGLPEGVEQVVRFYGRALTARKMAGGSVEVALAPDSNINRATRSDTLGTVIGDFALSEDAKAKSGLGLALRGSGYARQPLGKDVELLARASASASLYREKDFDDVIAGLQAGPQLASGGDRISLLAGPTWRWFGQQRYSTTLGGNASLIHPAGKRAQLRFDASLGHVTNTRNPLQTGWDYSAALGLDRQITARLGLGAQVQAFREVARDPGYSLASGGASAYAFREMGRTTLVASLSWNHLEADRRLFLYPHRRIEDRFGARLAATLRAFHVGTFAPIVRLGWERNRSTIEIYDYSRISAEFGVTSAF